MSRQFLLQRTPLADTLKRDEPVWETTNRRLTEKALRKLFWLRVNQPMHDTLYIYRMYNGDTNEVIT
jgi:hypothetical protein